MGVKVKTVKTTRSNYSIDGKSFWIEYTDEVREIMLNLSNYALRDVSRGTVPFSVNVSEDGLELKFDVADKETQEAFVKIFEQIHNDLNTDKT